MGKHLLAAIAVAGLATTVVYLLVPGAPKSPTRNLDEIKASLIESWNATRSVKATLSMEVEGPAAAKQRGTYEMKADGDRRLVRVELSLVAPKSQAPAASTVAPRMTSVSDGNHTYVMHEQGGKATAVRSAPDPSMHMDPVQFFARMDEIGVLELLPEETIDGREVVVIRIVPKGTELADGYVNYYLAKDCGLIVRMMVIEAAAGTTTRAQLSDIQLNVDIPSDRFVFHAPPGVVVQEAVPAP